MPYTTLCVKMLVWSFDVVSWSWWSCFSGCHFFKIDKIDLKLGLHPPSSLSSLIVSAEYAFVINATAHTASVYSIIVGSLARWMFFPVLWAQSAMCEEPATGPMAQADCRIIVGSLACWRFGVLTSWGFGKFILARGWFGVLRFGKFVLCLIQFFWGFINRLFKIL